MLNDTPDMDKEACKNLEKTLKKGEKRENFYNNFRL